MTRTRSYSPSPASGEIPITVEVDVDQPTAAEISAQIGALSAQITGVHAAALRADANSAAAVGEVVSLRTDVRQLRTTLLEDHAPRIRDVEQRARGSLAPAVKATGKYASIALAIPALLQLAATLKPNLAGPIQQIIELFQ